MKLGFRLPSAAKTLAGLSGDDQSASIFSGTMKLFPDLSLCIYESMNKISLLVSGIRALRALRLDGIVGW